MDSIYTLEQRVTKNFELMSTEIQDALGIDRIQLIPGFRPSRNLKAAMDAAITAFEKLNEPYETEDQKKSVVIEAKKAIDRVRFWLRTSLFQQYQRDKAPLEAQLAKLKPEFLARTVEAKEEFDKVGYLIAENKSNLQQASTAYRKMLEVLTDAEEAQKKEQQRRKREAENARYEAQREQNGIMRRSMADQLRQIVHR